MNLNNARVLQVDYGLFPEMGVRLARDVAKVFYFCEFRDAFADHFKARIGDGLEGLERIDDYENYLDKVDLIFVSDIQLGGLTEFLKSKGYAVCGAGKSEWLEVQRWDSRKYQKDHGLPVQSTWLIKGIDELTEFLKKNKNVIVKINNNFRGLQETFTSENFDSIEQVVDCMRWKLGPYKPEIEFVVEEKIEGTEPGLDGISWDGELMFPCMVGYEGKGVGCVERVYSSSQELPGALKMIDEGLSPEFKKNSMKFFYSAEIKIGKDRRY